MDKVKYNDLAELLSDDLNRAGNYLADSFRNMILDYVSNEVGVTGLEVTAQAVPDMTVYVRKGRIYQDGNQGTLAIDSQVLQVAPSNGQYPRIDRIVCRYEEIEDMPEVRNALVDVVSRQVIQKEIKTRIHGTIAFQVIGGVVAGSPTPPPVPEGWVPLAKITVPAGAEFIQQENIIDERPTILSLLNHNHKGGSNGAKINYDDLSNLPNLENFQLNLLVRNKYYAVGDIAYSSSLPSWSYLECITDGTTGATALNVTVTAIGQKIVDGTVTWVLRHKSESQNVGDIWMTKCEFNKDGYPVQKVTGLAMLDCHICDGTNGTIDMRDKFAMGTNSIKIGSVGGSNEKALGINNLPVHGHAASAWTDAQAASGSVGGLLISNGNRSGVFVNTDNYSGLAKIPTGNGQDWWREGSINFNQSHGHNIGISIVNTGGGQAFDSRPAWVGLAYVQKIY